MNEFCGRPSIASPSGVRADALGACLRRLNAARSETPTENVLARCGCLAPTFLENPAQLLRDVAAIDLSLGRLVEGHANALVLVRAWGNEDLAERCLRDAAEGHLFGVWGADDDPPVQAEAGRLRGAKRYASGLGLVSRAVVSARTQDGQRLFVVAADDPARQDPAAWDMIGMAESRSGRFDCDGLEGSPLGGPDIYGTEPLFIGGTWRIAAVTLGATIGLLDRAAAVLDARGHLDGEAQLLRLTPVAGRAVALWPAIVRAGRIAAGPEGATDPQKAVTLSGSVRLLSEDLGQDTIAAVERSVGLSMFAATDPVGRAARDLACYLRQAARDALCLTTGRALLGGASLVNWLDD